MSFKGSLNFFKPTLCPSRTFAHPPTHPRTLTNSYACREVKIAAPAYVLARLGNLTRLDGIAHP